MDITFRPRLSKGRHIQTVDEQGPFCLVEAVGFNVDGKVNDTHGSVDPVLASLARTLNDRMCQHYSHPIAEVAGMIAPTGEICDDCQARLWAVGERIAGTGYETPDWTEGMAATVHVQLALEAAGAVLRHIEASPEVYMLACAAIDAGTRCLATPTPEHRAAARGAASALEDRVQSDNTPTVWAAHTASYAVRAAAAVAGDNDGDAPMTYVFANRRAADAMGYALGATAGDAPASMRVARRVLNAFGKATSRNAAPGVSEPVASAEVWGGVHLDNAIGAALAEARAADAAVAAQDRRPVVIYLDGVAMTVPAVAAALAPTEEYEVVNDFDESEVGDVADEAIGELEHVEGILRGIAAEHRAVQQVARRTAGGAVQYFQDCCMSCRDVHGNPVPSPCRTLQLLDGYGG